MNAEDLTVTKIRGNDSKARNKLKEKQWKQQLQVGFILWRHSLNRA